MEHASKNELRNVEKSIDKLEGKVDQGFAHLEKKSDASDAKYASREAVMALHEKTTYMAQEISGMKVSHERDHGELKSAISGLQSTVKTWVAAAAIIFTLIQFVLGVYFS